MINIYGIKNCDTMKKAIAWLNDNNVDYHFHDYKKHGAPRDMIDQAIKIHGWDIVINKRGTTWRQLDDAVKQSMNDENALMIAMENPSIIKRPLLAQGDDYHIGFSADHYSEIFKS